jgi:hypothetical protein
MFLFAVTPIFIFPSGKLILAMIPVQTLFQTKAALMSHVYIKRITESYPE